jgi:hypothetical protein
MGVLGRLAYCQNWHLVVCFRVLLTVQGSLRDGNNTVVSNDEKHGSVQGYTDGLRIDTLLIDQSTRLLCTELAVMSVTSNPQQHQSGDASHSMARFRHSLVPRREVGHSHSLGLVGQLARLWRSSIEQ